MRRGSVAVSKRKRSLTLNQKTADSNPPIPSKLPYLALAPGSAASFLKNDVNCYSLDYESKSNERTKITSEYMVEA